MPELQDIAPLSVEPDWQRNRREELARQEADPTFRELGTAALLQGPVAAAWSSISKDPLFWEADPNFSLSPGDDLFKQLTDGIDPEYWPQFADAVSAQHGFFIRNMAQNRQMYHEQLSAAGASGVAASIVAGLADPVYLAAGIASGGLGVVAAEGRLAQMAASGLIAGGSFAGLEAFKQTQDPTITNADILLAGAGGALGVAAGVGTAGRSLTTRFLAGGAAQAAPTAAFDVFTDADRNDIMLNILPQFFLGGVMNSIGPQEHAAKVDAAARRALKTVELDIVNKDGAKPTAKGEAYFKEVRPIDVMTEHEKYTLAMGEWSPFEQAIGIDRANPDKITISVPVDETPQTFADLLKGTKSDFEKLLAGEPTAPTHKLVEVELPIRASELTFGDIQRLMHQVESSDGVVVPHGQEIETAPPAKTTVASDETGGPSAGVGAAVPTDPALQGKRVEKINEKPGDLNLDNVGDDPASFKRWDAAGMASRAEHPDIARAANMLGIDHVPKQGGQVYYTAPDAAESWHNSNMAAMFKPSEAAYDDYAKVERNARRVPMRSLEFFQAATDAYESGLPSGNPHIDQVVDVIRGVRKSDWDRAQRHLVPSTIGHEFDPNVIDRYTDRVQLDEAIATHGSEAMIDDIIIRLRRHPGNADIANDPVKLRAVAKSWLDNAATQSDRVSPWAAHSLEHDSVAIYADALRRAVPGLTDQQVNDIVYSTGPKKTDGGTPPKLRRQVRMDTAWENPSLVGPEGNAFKLNNILIRDILEIERMNSRYLSGRSAMSEVYRQFSTAGRNVEGIPQLIDVLKENAGQAGINPDVIKQDLARVEFMAKNVMGIPTHPSTTFTRIGRMLRGASFIRVINTATGIRNFTEVAGTVAENGLQALTKQIVPALGELFEKIRAGKVDNEATVNMHQMGLAVGELTHKLLPTPEEGEYVPKTKGFEYNLNKKLRVADRAIQRGVNLTSAVSLVGPGQVALERTAFRLLSQRWLQMAKGKSPMLSEARLRAATLSPEMAKRIIDQMNLPGAASYDATPAGDVWAGWNYDKWNDIEAVTAFRQAMYKTNRRQVYRPHASELAQWMSGDIAKLFTQLRTFMLGSYYSKTLFNVKMADRTAITSMGAQLLSKAMAYYGITYLYSLGQPDREKYLRDRLDPGRVARAAFSNSEFSSIVPMAVDVVQAARGKQPYFAFARTTGLGDAPGAWGLVTSNPTADTIDKSLRAISSATGIDKLLGYFEYHAGLSRTWDPRIHQRDVKNIEGGLPWQRMLGIDQFFRQVVDWSPKERK